MQPTEDQLKETAERSQKLKKVIAKIQQLRAISESTHSKHEKETTILLATKLINEYQLEEAELQAVSKDKEEIDYTTEHILFESGKTSAWKQRLAFDLADLNNLFAYKSPIRDRISHRQGSRFRIIGYKTDLEVCQYMFNYLLKTIAQLVNEEVPTNNKRGKNPARESWCLGCVNGFIDKMKRERAEVMKKATSSALVFIGSKKEEIEEGFKAQSNLKFSMTQRSKAQTDAEKYRLGFAKGQTLNVQPGLGANQTDIKKLGG